MHVFQIIFKTITGYVSHTVAYFREEGGRGVIIDEYMFLPMGRDKLRGQIYRVELRLNRITNNLLMQTLFKFIVSYN